jgi:hypothetical protein
LRQKKNAVEDFVANWIEQEIKRTGDMPKDFTLFEKELPQFRQKLSDDGLRVSERWLTLRSHQLFNLNVGIEQVVNLRFDTQLQEAIRIIKAGEVGRTIQLYQSLEQMLKFMGKELQTLANVSEH